MNVAGPLASLIFATTALTVFGGLFAYAVYKARERRRAAPARGVALQYFLEYTPPRASARDAEGAATRRRPWEMYLVSGAAVVGLIAATLYYYRTGRRYVLQGAWSRPGGGANKEFPAPPDWPRAVRGREPSLAASTRRASPFPSARFDANGDGVIQPGERALLHDEVPLSVILTVDDNGSAQGLAWLSETFERHRLRGDVTFFLTGNYAEGRPSYLGGPMNAWWSRLAQDGFVGLHGLSHESGIEWSRQRWSEEHRATIREITSRAALPPGWSWTSYPFGSRAPYLAFDDEYLSALDRTTPAVVYDASMIVHPNEPLPATLAELGPRDPSWPFSLDVPLPDDVELPFSEAKGQRVKIGKHATFEVPVYAWAVSKSGGGLRWVPSLDVDLFGIHPCTGAGANAAIVEAFEHNLDAHYGGNRAPFHLGLHAQNYTADKACERSTLEAMLDAIDRRVGAGRDIRYESAPRLLERLVNDGQEQGGAGIPR